MTRINMIAVCVVCAVAFSQLAGSQASAQSKPVQAGAKGAEGAADIRVRELKGNGTSGLLRPPVYAADNTTRSSNRPRDWHEISVSYDTKPEWITQLVCKYYVLMLNNNPKANKTPYTLLEGTVTYIQVPGGNDHLSSMLLHPNTISRFGEVVACAVEMTAGETTVEKSDIGAKAKLSKTGKWWTAIASDEKNVTVMDGYLLSRDKTPFAFINFDDYEQVQR